MSNKVHPGHAVLCYKVEVYDGGSLKLYVLDPNFIYADQSVDFKSITYIIIGMNNGQQFFVYNPSVNENYFYQGYYNSYLPGALFQWN